MPISSLTRCLPGRIFGGAALTAAALLAGLGSTASAQAEDAAAAASPRPNVVLVVIDDLNHDVGYAGLDVHTPNLDRLAERGRVFMNAHTNSPVCNPSRTSFLLGKYPHTIGVTDNDTFFRELPAFRDAVTMPQFFRNNGYHVAGAGKIFHSGWRPPSNPRHKFVDRNNSWDEYNEVAIGTPVPRPHPNDWHGGRVRTWWGKSFWWATIDAEDEETGDWKNSDFIAKRLEQPPAHGKPMFLAAGIFRPHLPFVAPRKYMDLYPPQTGTPTDLPGLKEGDRRDLPPTGRKWSNKTGVHGQLVRTDLWGEALAAYRASTTFADACVGRILEAYDNSPVRDNTYLVLTSDHGFHLGEKGAWSKFTFWDRSTRVPFIVVGPGIEPGVTTRTVSLIDLFPTFASLEAYDNSPVRDNTYLVLTSDHGFHLG
ncbi:MAG: sulfatase, partial [Planctomycetota bacterium]